MPKVEDSYVPELVRLYGDQGKVTRQRKTRLQRIVVGRNRDAHTASLAQTGNWLDELKSDVDDILGELDFLRSYTVVAAKSVEITPDRRASHLSGVRCHGISERYASVTLPIKQIVSRREVILVKADRSEYLSLRPWLLYLDSGADSRGGGEELALLNAIDDRRLDHVGLISGAEYRPENNWRTFTVYELDASQASDAREVTGQIVDIEVSDSASIADEIEVQIAPKIEDTVAIHLERLASSYESIVIQSDRGAHGTEYFVSVRTPAKDVAIATVDSCGTVWIYPRSLERAAEQDLIVLTRLYELLDMLVSGKTGHFTTEAALIEIGHIAEQAEWLSVLAHSFAD